jgi:hypothetical protein
MIYRFLLLSDEVDDFKREITIDSEATFLDLHHVILDSVGYAKDQMASFFICGDDWTKLTEITLVKMDTNFDEDNYTMEETRLSEGLEEEGQKLMYIFDYLTDRAFYMELREIITGKSQTKAECIKSAGNPPVQLLSFDEIEMGLGSPFGMPDENFYGDEDFNPDELDEEGFGGLGPIEGDNPYDDF